MLIIDFSADFQFEINETQIAARLEKYQYLNHDKAKTDRFKALVEEPDRLAETKKACEDAKKAYEDERAQAEQRIKIWEEITELEAERRELIKKRAAMIDQQRPKSGKTYPELERLKTMAANLPRYKGRRKDQ